MLSVLLADSRVLSTEHAPQHPGHGTGTVHACGAHSMVTGASQHGHRSTNIVTAALKPVVLALVLVFWLFRVFGLVLVGFRLVLALVLVLVVLHQKALQKGKTNQKAN